MGVEGRSGKEILLTKLIFEEAWFKMLIIDFKKEVEVILQIKLCLSLIHSMQGALSTLANSRQIIKANFFIHAQ